MTNTEIVIKRLQAIDESDTEAAHAEADDLILKFLADNGFADVTDAWDDVSKRCHGFWYA